jgi:phage terminase large subunit-like protein
MECKIVSDELAVFRSDLLRYYDVLPALDQLKVILTCDPVPPPSEREIALGFKGKDSEAWAALGVWIDPMSKQRKIFVLETSLMTGHDPDWSVKTFFEMLDRWHPYKLKVESVNYQRTLAWLIEKAMKRARKFVQIDAHTPERRKKHYRIIDAIGAALSAGELYVHQSQQSLIQAIHSYPNVEHDDEIEAVAVGVAELMNVSPFAIMGGGDYIEAEKDIPELTFEDYVP